MPSVDIAGIVHEALETHWGTAHPAWKVALHVDDNFRPAVGKPTLLVADDGSIPVNAGAWLVRKTMRRRTLRYTAFAKGRDEALAAVNDAVDHIITNRPAGLARIEDVSDPLVTRDRETGAFLASITMPVIVKPVTA
ncbi:hypothetical protein [Mycolicibacterium peregrinum]|uniref:hypothetical protein n=1 Tax=Mycolicibacterium peregrinum TaxID=43304 RepID=UPI003AAE0AAA